MSKIYFDNASTTRLNGEALNAMMPYFTDNFGNASSRHSFGRESQSAIDNARDIVAKSINAKSSEIIFTSGGTESNNFAIKGVALANQDKGKHIIVSQVEHPSIIDSCKELEKLGFEISYIPVDENGLVSMEELLHAIRRDTILVSIMAVNNEVGTIQHVKTIGKIVEDYENAHFHCDAVQAMTVLEIDVIDMHIDLLTLSAHKIHGPKGVGALYIKKGVKVTKLIEGGEQELNKRGGTQNVAAIVGFAKAVELTVRDLKSINRTLRGLSNYFLKKLEYEIQGITINAKIRQRAPGIINVSFNYVDAETILVLLDQQGIAVSTGSACTAGSAKKSHVLQAMGKTDDEVNSSVRFSFSVDNTRDEIDVAIRTLTNIVEKIRINSPLYNKNFRKVGVKNV